MKSGGQHSVSGRKAPVGATHHDPIGEEGFEGDTHDRGRIVNVFLGVEIGVVVSYNLELQCSMWWWLELELVAAGGTSRGWNKL